MVFFELHVFCFAVGPDLYCHILERRVIEWTSNFYPFRKTLWTAMSMLRSLVCCPVALFEEGLSHCPMTICHFWSLVRRRRNFVLLSSFSGFFGAIESYQFLLGNFFFLAVMNSCTSCCKLFLFHFCTLLWKWYPPCSMPAIQQRCRILMKKPSYWILDFENGVNVLILAR